MANNLPDMFSLRHFLVLSLALNVSLILKMVYESSEEGNTNKKNLESRGGGNIVHKSRLAITSPATPSLANSSTHTDHHPGDSEGVIKLDQLTDRRVVYTNPYHPSQVWNDHAAESSCPLVGQSSTIHNPLSAESVKQKRSISRLLDLSRGDPTMYERYWRRMGDRTTIVIPGWQSMSYFSDPTKICWFLEPEFEKEVVRLHNVVGNAVTEGRYIVVGTGSSQLILATLYALSSHDAAEPISVVSEVPYYSSYPSMTDYQKSGLYKWAGDAKSFDKEGPYIEFVTSPSNPDGHTRQPLVNRSQGLLIHDLAYYWPQHTPILSVSDYDLTLFTVSKSTGHAGSRIGWALVKDIEVAKKMTKFIELSTIGVSKDSQLRAAKVLRTVSDTCEEENSHDGESFFKYSYKIMAQRWKILREAVEGGDLFSLPKFSSAFCTFFNQESEPQPAFAWLKCEGDIEDCESFLRGHKILTRGGRQFGASPKYVRISMLDTDENFMLLIDRLSTIEQ